MSVAETDLYSGRGWGRGQHRRLLRGGDGWTGHCVASLAGDRLHGDQPEALTGSALYVHLCADA